MEILSFGFLFLFGLVIGSFLNVAIRRPIRGESLFGRSHCESCKKTLTAFELIPVFSFLVLRGRCRSCNSPLSLQYPLVELGTALAFLLVGVLFSPQELYGWSFLLFIKISLILIGLSASIVIFVVDLKEKIIPDSPFFILFGTALFGALLRYTSFYPYSFDSSLFLKDAGAALCFAFFFAALWFFSGGAWMGFGDAKLVLATSLALGYPVSIAAFLFSFWLGGIGGGVLLLMRRVAMKSQIPFGPFILAASVIAYFSAPYFFEESRLLEGIYELLR